MCITCECRDSWWCICYCSPVANSSGSVTNQAIQVLQGPYITNQYGDGISCQGPTLNFTPYVTRSTSWQFPFESHYADPVYNMLDLTGDFDDDNNPIPDGIPDNPVTSSTIEISERDKKITTTGTQDSQQQSQPLDKKQQTLCKEAAQHHNDLRGQMLANRRLEFEFYKINQMWRDGKERYYLRFMESLLSSMSRHRSQKCNRCAST